MSIGSVTWSKMTYTETYHRLIDVNKNLVSMASHHHYNEMALSETLFEDLLYSDNQKKATEMGV